MEPIERARALLDACSGRVAAPTFRGASGLWRELQATELSISIQGKAGQVLPQLIGAAS